MNLKALIVEDEENSQELLSLFLSDYCPDISIVGFSKTITKAIKLIAKEKPDIVFLDIELEDGNGFELLNQFSPFEFLTIFITGYENFTLDALRHSACDYILKPFSIVELKNAVARAKSRVKIWETINVIVKSENNLIQEEGKLILRTAKKTKVITLNEILYIDSDDPYSRIYLTNGNSLYIQERLKKLNDFLPDYFFRIHKSYLVNLKMVKEWDHGRGGNLLLNDNTELTISYRNKKEFKERIESLKLNQ
ncbi:LytR/AlgR family response regulator transcription factor [Winogradskyella sp. R77965]|uniref:LytR/AlgR family response regulator transcription factor n=1 Tax=Winogradskyella sp. R77965 TaxID=3093872 RepID=UPI0037DC839E